MSTLELAESLMETATTEVGLATFILPPSVSIYMEFKASTGNATELDKAGQEWRKAAQQIEELCADLQQSITSVSAQDWSGTDRPAYEAKVKEFCSQMEVLQTFCQAVGITLTTLAYALLSYAVFAAAMGHFIAGLAAAAIAAAASIVAAPSISAMQATAATCATITHVSTGILAAAGQMGAMALAGGSFVSAVAESRRGNEAAMGDFFQAQATGSAAALSTLAQNGANLGLAYVNRMEDALTPEGVKVTLPKGSPLKEIDLDADRSYDRTWSVGGGATVETGLGSSHEFGGHVKYGDRKWQGAEGEYAYSGPGGAGFEAKGAWEENDKGQNVYSGGVSGGYTNDLTGMGATGGVEGTYNSATQDWSGMGEGTAQYKGGDVYRGTYEAEGQGGSVTQQKYESESMLKNETPPWDLV